MTINRGITKKSQYFFNSKTGQLEKIDSNVNTIKTINNKRKEKINSLSDLVFSFNDNQETEPVNSISIITEKDNLIHNYFYDMEISWDASNCLSNGIIKMPKIDEGNINYWANYAGQLVIYAGNNFTFDYVNDNYFDSVNGAAQSLTKYWDNSQIKPIFKGDIAKIKEFDKDATIYLDSIGRRFQQKIPDDFRQSYINNQNVRDAFQAICEFLGVDYICPPKVVEDNGSTVTDSSENKDGTENSIDTQKQNEQDIKNAVKNKTQENIETDKNTNDTTTSSDTISNNEEIKQVQNGYSDISFDANGAIVHNSVAIENSPDMAETLLSMEENPLEKYLEDETGIVEKVQKFLDGEMFEELHGNVMDYGAITVQPASTTTSEISSVSTESTNTESTSGEEENQAKTTSNNLLKNAKSNTILQNIKIVKKALSYDEVNKLTPKQARNEMVKTSNYYNTTILRLRARARGYYVGPNTPYSKFVNG